MLDIKARVTVDEAQRVFLYRDHEDRTRFYALPSSPRLAHDKDGGPQIDLLLYGRKQGNELAIDGGQLTLVTSLALSQEERAGVQAALARLLETENPPVPGPSPPTPSLLTPEWLSATVEVELGHGLRLEGMPSMMGDNECALSLSLTSDQARALKDWDRCLAGVVLRYRGEVTTIEDEFSSHGETSESTESNLYGTRAASSDTGLHFRRVRAVALPLLLEGRLELGNEDLCNRIQMVGL